MNHEEWLTRWREGRTGWHQSEVTPLLLQHWADVRVPAGSCVLVPLCGKTLDMLWLAAQGLDVLGVELSELAVQQFFDENELRPQRQVAPDGVHYRAGRVHIIVGDIFDVDADALARCTAVYDRAALIAQPPVQRRRYVHDIYGQLPRASRGLLISLEYAQASMTGPPFSVAQDEVQALFGADWNIELAVRRPTTGPDRAEELQFNAAAYRLERR